MTSREQLAWAVVATPAVIAVLLLIAPRRVVTPIALVGAFVTAVPAIVLSILAFRSLNDPVVGRWIVVDAAGALLIAVVAVVGLATVLASPAYLAGAHSSLGPLRRRSQTYFAVLYAFWAVLLAVTLAGNLGLAWLLIEATTAASALLVGFSGKARALEAAWKYLVLTSLGLGVALLGIVILVAGIPEGGIGALSWRALATYSSGSQSAVVAYVLLLSGLAAKVGWAPVHNWLPDAHSEAPPPISALLSAALLPAVLLVAWRSEHALVPVIGVRAGQDVLIFFGLVSLAVAVPFLWRSLPWKRLLAYSSLEHMGVIALGIGFGTPLALAGVAVHITAHAVAKATGFYAATPLVDARASRRGARRHRYRANASRARRRDGHLSRRARRPATVAAVSERGAHRRRRLRGGPLLGCSRNGRAARARLPRPRARAARDDGGQGSAPCAGAGRRSQARRARRCVARSAARALRRCALAARIQLRRGAAAGNRMSEHQDGGSYRDEVEDALARGWRFAGLHATSDGTRVRALLADATGATRLETVLAREGAVPSIVDLAPAAGWDEREAHDLQGVGFTGHEPLRPLVDHDLDLDRWTVPVRGRDAYQVAVGPIHAGIIESGHFRLHVVGERILHLDARLFYKHRGLERAAEGHTLDEGMAYATRACAACAVANGVAYAHACEDALGLCLIPSSPAHARSCSSSSGCGVISTTLPPCAPASGSLRATITLRRSPSVRAGSTRASQVIASSSGRSRVGRQ